MNSIKSKRIVYSEMVWPTFLAILFLIHLIHCLEVKFSSGRNLIDSVSLISKLFIFSLER